MTILCGLCVRICRERMGPAVADFVGRGPDMRVDTPYHRGSEVCISCGACEHVCPTQSIRLKTVYPEPPRVRPTARPSEFEMGLSSRPIPPLKKGGLGGAGFFKKTTSARRKLLVKLAKKQGEKTIGGRLGAIAVFNKRVNPALAAKARADRHYLMGTMKGKTVVGYPEGFRKRM